MVVSIVMDRFMMNRYHFFEGSHGEFELAASMSAENPLMAHDRPEQPACAGHVRGATEDPPCSSGSFCCFLVMGSGRTQLTMLFKYSSWWSAVKDVGDVCDDVYVHSYTPHYKAMKINRQGTVQPFLHRGMLAKRIPQDHPLIDKYAEDFAYGGYIVQSVVNTAEQREHKQRKKELYIVNVVKRTRPFAHGDVMFTADHFSFLINHSVRLKLQLHRTNYAEGRADPIPNHLPLEFRVTTIDAFANAHVHSQRFRPYANIVHDILTMLPTPASQTQSDGKPRHGPRKRSGRVATFDDIWWNLPIRYVRVFAIPTPENAGQHDVTVYVVNRLQRDESEHLAFCTRVPSFKARSEPELRNVVGDLMKGVTCQDFEFDGNVFDNELLYTENA
jgi:hypothetical protein